MYTSPQVLIKRSERRTLALQVTAEGVLLVKAPLWISQRDINQFLSAHSEWIEKHTRRKKISLIKSDCQYLFLGKAYDLEVGVFTKIALQGDSLQFPQALLFRKEKELTSWYIHQADKIILPIVDRFAREMKTSFREVSFSDTSSQWGRCTRDNRLQFSWRLVMAPLLVIQYVVIHELAHTLEKNHTQLFWMKVRNYNPSYRQQIKWLKEHGEALHGRFT